MLDFKNTKSESKRRYEKRLNTNITGRKTLTVITNTVCLVLFKFYVQPAYEIASFIYMNNSNYLHRCMEIYRYCSINRSNVM